MARIRKFNTSEVLNKAMLLFWDRGYNGVSTQELIDDFGMSKSSMYGAFGDKKELFTIVLKLYSSRIIEDLECRFSKSKKVEAVFHELFYELSCTASRDSKGCFIVNSAIELAPHDAKVAQLVEDHRLQVEQLFTIAIQKGIDVGEFSYNINSSQVSKLITNGLNGIYVAAKFIKDINYFTTVSSSLLSSLV